MVLEALEVDQAVQEGLEGLGGQEVLREVQGVQVVLEVQEGLGCQGTIWIAAAQFLCRTCRHSHHQTLSLEGSLSPPSLKGENCRNVEMLLLVTYYKLKQRNNKFHCAHTLESFLGVR